MGKVMSTNPSLVSRQQERPNPSTTKPLPSMADHHQSNGNATYPSNNLMPGIRSPRQLPLQVGALAVAPVGLVGAVLPVSGPRAVPELAGAPAENSHLEGVALRVRVAGFGAVCGREGFVEIRRRSLILDAGLGPVL